MLTEKQTTEIPLFSGLTCDSRKVKPGYAFFAIKGFEEDGNKYIEEAIRKGANVVFTEKFPVISKKNGVPIIQVTDIRKMMANFAAEFYHFPSGKLNIIGVTGTNGKTTTTHLIYDLLNYQEKQSGLIGTVKIDTGAEINPGKLTTPESISLQKYFKQMNDNNLKYVCMEVSSHGIKLKRIEATSFNVKIGTNITEDHFDLHSDFNDYVATKKKFLSGSNSNVLVLLNNDDKYLRAFGKIAEKQINYGLKGNIAVKAEKIKIRQNNITTNFLYRLNTPLYGKDGVILPCSFPVQIFLPGKHNIYNTLIAITTGLYYGLSQETIQKFFKNYRGVWRRLQVIYDREFTIIDDCAHNPGSYEAVFNTINDINYNNLHIVNSLRGNRSVKINRANAETISYWLSHLDNYNLYTSNCSEVVKKNDRVKDKEEQVFLQVLKNNKINFTHFQKLKPALLNVLRKKKEGDLILLLGPHAMDNAGEMLLKLL